MRILILILSLSTSVIYAQWNTDEFNKTKFHYGVKIGVTASNLLGDDIDFKSFDSKFGIEVGGVFLYTFNSLLSMQTEILFTQKGYIMISNQESDVHTTFNYLQIPIVVGFRLLSRLKLYLGAYFSTFTNIWISSSELSYEEESKIEDEIQGSINNFDLGGVLGLTFRGNNNLLFDLRYERAFMKLYNTGQNIYTNTFNLSITWLF